MTNLANGLVDAARLHDGRPALRLGDTKVSFVEVDDASARIAAMLRGKGLHPGARARQVIASGRSCRDHAAERVVVSADLLRGVAGRRGGRADEPVAEVSRG